MPRLHKTGENMRTVEIEGVKIDVRSIKRKERRAKDLDKYGYHAGFFAPPVNEDGTVDMELFETGRDVVLELVLGEGAIDKIDDAAGEAGIREAWKAIIDETYGNRDEEKN